MNNNVELWSDWLFHSTGHFSSSHSRKETQGKYIFQILSYAVISLGNSTVK